LSFSLPGGGLFGGPFCGRFTLGTAVPRPEFLCWRGRPVELGRAPTATRILADLFVAFLRVGPQQAPAGGLFVLRWRIGICRFFFWFDPHPGGTEPGLAAGLSFLPAIWKTFRWARNLFFRVFSPSSHNLTNSTSFFPRRSPGPLFLELALHVCAAYTRLPDPTSPRPPFTVLTSSDPSPSFALLPALPVSPCVFFVLSAPFLT